ncbi:MAG: right-handed parallel beta-helix repeat-containing protein [Dehalococcoidales bacterium]|nr:right-handed parallel beta-helix repeat-containing protein [Dehalococcoidales bacterium]
MKKTIFKIFSLALTVALLASLCVGFIPAGAVTIVAAGPDDPTISATANYTIDMTGALNLYNDDVDYIRVIFPLGFNIEDVDTAEINGAPAYVDDFAEAAGILDIDVPADLTVGDIWEVEIFGVINPDAAGYYTLSVATSKEPAAVQSAPFMISSPGIIQYYNAAGAYLGTEPAIGLLPPLQEGWTVKVGAGAYPGVFELYNDDITVTSTGGSMIIGGFDVDASFCSIDGFMVMGFGFTSDIEGAYNTLDNMTWMKSDTMSIPASMPEFFLYVGGYSNTVSNSSFDATTIGGYADTCILVGGENVTIEDCNFTLDQTIAYYPDYGIETNTNVDGLTVTGCTFNGSSGVGYRDWNNSGFNTPVEISNNTFTGLEHALVIWGCKGEVFGNTIQDSTVNNEDFTGAIDLYYPFELRIFNNQIKDNAGFAIAAFGQTHTAWITGNNITGNTMNVLKDGSELLNADHNYWGDAEGPAAASMIGDTEDIVYEPFLTVANTSAYAYFAWTPDDGWMPNSPVDSRDASFAVRNYDWDYGIGSVCGQTLSGNPTDLEPPFPAIAYFDIFLSSPPDYAATQINLYADGLTNASNIYYWSGAMEGWTLCSDQGVAGSGAYVWFKVAPAGEMTVFGDETTPAPDEMQDTYFVIVDGIAPPAEPFELGTIGIDGVTGLSNIPFSWPAFPGATGYKVVIWTTDPNNPAVSQMTTIPSYMVGSLPAGSYFIQVFAMQGENVIGESQIGTFVAQAPPSTETVPPITITTQPAATITITQPAETTITIPSPEVTEITPAWIWAIIGIGAILVIVVIVLIVRTRRTS